MKNLKVILFSLFAFSMQTQAAGLSGSLSGGDQYSSQTIIGSLTVQCSSSNGRISTAFADCRGNILNPGEYSYFIGPISDADQVSLVATHEDGSVSKKKTQDYDGLHGKSKKTFNLWISTVFQRPLLNKGKNNINYQLLKDGKSIEEGSFIVNVVDGGRAVCQRSGFYYSSMESDCTVPTNLCSRYFSENNYCQ